MISTRCSIVIVRHCLCLKKQGSWHTLMLLRFSLFSNNSMDDDINLIFPLLNDSPKLFEKCQKKMNSAKEGAGKNSQDR